LHPRSPPRLAGRPIARVFVAASLFWLFASGTRSDVGALFVSSDFDAEFARAADLLEEGRRADAEHVLSEIRRQAGQRAWDARVAMLLAVDDERHANFAAAARGFEGTSAAPIGLESYRRDRLARDLAASGETDRALVEYAALEDSDDAYAGAVRTALDHAALLERSGAPARAAAVLAHAASRSPSSSLELAPQRLRLALRTGDAAGARAAARQILLEAPLADVSGESSAELRQALRAEEARLSPADKARRGRALVSAGDYRRGAAILEPAAAAGVPLASEERDATLLALARAEARLGRTAKALAAASRVAANGSAASYEARLFRIDVESGRGAPRPPRERPEDREARLATSLRILTSAEAPPAVRAAARERLVRLAYETGDYDAGLVQARALVAESAGTRAGFEPLWRLAWDVYRDGRWAIARARFETLGALYASLDFRRRLTYWRARCLEHEGYSGRANLLFQAIARADPPDLYALFARRRVSARMTRRPALPDPSEATATFRRVDELLRLRLFDEASAEARRLPASRGRDLRLAESEFALGRFAAASLAAKRAFPEMGTAEEGRVPDAWRRLYYPIEEGGFLAQSANEFSLDPAILRALVRQESLFEARARSRAGALGLTQLLPSTAKSVARSVLRVRYRRAFLYDPGVNAQLGAAYLRRLYDQFDGNGIYALAAYNGGPGRMAAVLAQNRGLDEDEIFESHPAWESRDYVRRVLLYSESYRELYPQAPVTTSPPARPEPSKGSSARPGA
jgi:soluble lytic murein transglycosylase